jgi:hypothetical protein
LVADPTRQNLYDLQELNPYAYVDNNPLSLTDPTGYGDGGGAHSGGTAGSNPPLSTWLTVVTLFVTSQCLNTNGDQLARICWSAREGEPVRFESAES